MNTGSRSTRRVAALSVLIVALLALVAVWQRNLLPSAFAAQQPPAAAQPPQRAAPRGRLPNFYGNVVTADQRERIYAIQAEFEPRIADLEKQLAALIDERDSAVEGVLTPEQLKQVDDLREAARREREQRAAAPAAAPAPASSSAGGQ